MTSLLTNHGAISALANLRQISQELSTNQRQVSSGLRVQQASDDAAYWSIGTTMRSDSKALSAVQDALGLGAAAVDTAYTGMSAAIEVVMEIKAKLVTAREASVDKLKINEELEQLKGQIYSIVESASFSGQNWLHRIDDTDDADKQVVGSFTRTVNSVSLQTLTYDMSNQWGTNHLIDENYHNGILTNVEFARELGLTTEWVLLSGKNHDIHEDMILTADTTEQDIDEMVSVLEMMLGAMADAGARLGALVSRIEMQTEFVADLRDATDQGIGRLVDADMHEAATRSKALETQQQMATQALSMANTQPDILLRLFQ